ncbi:MAG: HlyD family efflux transporter periplasmic adaptor subunit [Candidatus Dadabacteria bacterium]|nr:HlyD family efflux transporter periplasmic adaptor subunit [Candidatus Dadabacteria bacterium]
MIKLNRAWLLRIALVVLAGIIAFYAWKALRPNGLPEGFAGSNGRIEATEINVAAKMSGRIKEIMVNEGDFVTAGEVLAVMDTAVLEAQQREAGAQLERALIGIETAEDQVAQRKAEKSTAEAVVAQRKAELSAAQKRLSRTEKLAERGIVPAQKLDDDRAELQRAKAAVSAADAQVAAAEAAISAARSQIVASKSEAEAMRATIQRIKADIDDSTLRSPRGGRVQYRVAQPGEVLNAGGVVLNLVDLSDVYMTFFLPTEDAGRVKLGAEARIILDAAPQYVIPAKITFVADVAQFTPKSVETAEERQKLMFRLKAQIPPDLLRKHIEDVKTGLPGMAYVRLAPNAEWPAGLEVRLPQ